MDSWISGIAAVAIGAVVWIVLAPVRRQRDNLGTPDAAPATAVTEDLTFAGSFRDAFQQALNIMDLAGAELTQADSFHGRIVGQVRGAVLGIRRAISFRIEAGESGTRVSVSAWPCGIPLDFGGCARLLRDVRQAWDIHSRLA